MKGYLWEAERGATLLARSKAGRSTRRRAEVLQRQGRRSARAGSGVRATGLSEELTPSLAQRLLRMPGEGSGGPRWKALKALVIWGGALLVLHVLWGAMLLGWLVYRGLEDFAASRLGRRMFTVVVPALVAVSALAFAGAEMTDWLAPISLFGAMAHLPLGGGYIGNVGWIVWQLCLSPLFAAWSVWAWGWDGAGQPRRSQFDANGQFRKPTAREMRDLHTFEGETKAQPVAKPVAYVVNEPVNDETARSASGPAAVREDVQAAAEADFEPEPDWFGLPDDDEGGADGGDGTGPVVDRSSRDAEGTQ